MLPFSDGNGRSSRIFSYIVLSVSLNYFLPGERTVTDQIVARRIAYFAALEAADVAGNKGRVDVSHK